MGTNKRGHALMEGQTEEERRKLRAKIRANAIKIDKQGDDIGNANLDTFEKLINKQDALFEDIRYTREADMDQQNIYNLSLKAKKQSDGLNDSVNRNDAKKV